MVELSSPVVRLGALALTGIALSSAPAAQWRLPIPKSRPDLSSYEAIDEALDGRALLPLGATWRYFIGVEEPSPGLEWTKPSFDDSSWKEGPSGFGYGAEPQATDLSEMKGKATTVYLRHVLRVEDPAAFWSIRLEVPMDDGMVFYLNGAEEARQHADDADTRMPYIATATAEREPDERPLPTFDLTRALRAGDNMLAIQALVHADDTKSLVLKPRVWVRYRVREDEEAARLETFSHYLQENADLARLAYLQGRHFQRIANHEAALEPLFRAAQFDPGAALPWKRLLESHRELGRVEELEARMRRYVQGGLGTPPLYDTWAHVVLEDLGLPTTVLPELAKGAAEIPAKGLFADALWAGEQLAAGETLRIDAGSTVDRGENGSTWSHDRFFTGGTALELELPEAVAEVPDDPGAPAEASAPVEPRDVTGRLAGRSLDQIAPLYRMPLVNGTYELRLQVAGGERLFQLLLQGSSVVRHFRTVGTEQDVETVAFPVHVDDGFLDLDLVPIEGLIPVVLAFEVEPLDAERYREAVGRWVAAEPELALARVQEAEILRAAGDLRGATLTLEAAAKLDGFRPADRRRLQALRDELLPVVVSHASVEDLVKRRRDARAVQEAVAGAAEDEETEALALYFEGRLLQLAGQFDEATGIFEELVFGGTDSPLPYVRMAECLRTADLYDAALGILQEGLDAGIEPSPELLRLWFTLELGDLEGDPWDVIARLRELGVEDLSPVPTSEYAGQLWQWTPIEPPVTSWSRTAYDASAWEVVEGGLGSSLLPDAEPRTLWNGRRMFARRPFDLGGYVLLYPHVRVNLDDAGEVYLNGQTVTTVGWNTLGYRNYPLREGSLEAGENVLGMVGFNIRDASFGDCGIVEPLEDLYWVQDCLAEDGALRINCNGDDFTTADGRLFHADRFQAGAIPGTLEEGTEELDIAGTEDDDLYRTYRWWYGAETRYAWYQIPIPNGSYRVTLHFAEMSSKALEKPRTFDVMIEDELRVEDLDVAAAHGLRTATRMSFETTVTDGWMDVTFLDKDNDPFLNALEIVALD